MCYTVRLLFFSTHNSFISRCLINFTRREKCVSFSHLISRNEGFYFQNGINLSCYLCNMSISIAACCYCYLARAKFLSRYVRFGTRARKRLWKFSGLPQFSERTEAAVCGGLARGRAAAALKRGLRRRCSARQRESQLISIDPDDGSSQWPPWRRGAWRYGAARPTYVPRPFNPSGRLQPTLLSVRATETRAEKVRAPTAHRFGRTFALLFLSRVLLSGFSPHRRPFSRSIGSRDRRRPRVRALPVKRRWSSIVSAIVIVTSRRRRRRRIVLRFRNGTAATLRHRFAYAAGEQVRVRVGRLRRWRHKRARLRPVRWARETKNEIRQMKRESRDSGAAFVLTKSGVHEHSLVLSVYPEMECAVPRLKNDMTNTICISSLRLSHNAKWRKSENRSFNRSRSKLRFEIFVIS